MVTVGGIFYRKTSKVFKLFADPKVWRKQLRLLPEEALGAQPASCVSMLCLCACLCVCVFFLLYKSLDRARFCWVKHYLGMQTRAMYSSSTSDAIWCSAMWLGGMRCNALSCTDTRSTYVTCKYLLFCKVHAFLHVVIV